MSEFMHTQMPTHTTQEPDKALMEPFASPFQPISAQEVQRYLQSGQLPQTPAPLRGNIERFVGYLHVPIGLAGPLSIRGDHAQGNYYVPLATTEGALVASYNRGMKAIRLSGGCRVISRGPKVQRSPYFQFEHLDQAAAFAHTVERAFDTFHQLTRRQSRHAQLLSATPRIEGNAVRLMLTFDTADAAGQNMATFCAEEICQYIIHHLQPKPLKWYLESNLSGDKKASALSFIDGRGHWACAEVVLPPQVVADVLKSSPVAMARYWQVSTLSTAQALTYGTVGHVANALTALFLACGQDVACVTESAVGILRIEQTDCGALYASLTLPSLVIGTVGGGTALPTQRECLKIIDCEGTGKAAKFAEIATATALAGELSIAAALAEGHFAQAHRQLGRKPKSTKS